MRCMLSGAVLTIALASPSLAALPSGRRSTDELICYTFYDVNVFLQGGLECPSRCPYRTTCQGDNARSACARADDCAKLLKRGQLVGNPERNATTPQHAPRCVSCAIGGCSHCAMGADSTIVCGDCRARFRSNDQGGCEWDRSLWTNVWTIILLVLGALVTWILADVVRAELAPITNRAALERGLVMRRRAQFFKARDTEGGHRIIERYSLTQNLHGRRSGAVGGPGLTLFMNWFFLVMSLSVWLCFCAAVLAPSSTEEPEHLDPCLQQRPIVSSGEQGRLGVGREEGEGGQYLGWTQCSYIGSSIISIAFLVWQTHLWSAMVADSRRLSLRGYCVELSGVPSNLTDKALIQQHLGQWMDRLHLDGGGIRQISIAYAISMDAWKEVDRLIDLHLRAEVQAHGGVVNEKSFRDSEEGQQQSAPRTGPWWIRLMARFLFGTSLRSRAQSQYFDQAWWNQLVAVVVFGTPLRSSAQKQSEVEISDVDQPETQRFLDDLLGSGYVYVVMETEALAKAVASMGVARLEGLAAAPIRVRSATMEPINVRWRDYAPQPLLNYFFVIAKAVVVLLLALFGWLCFFSWYLTFELLTHGNQSYTKSFIGTFVIGLMVPIGNNLLGIVIDMQTESIGFRDDGTLRLWRLILNVLVNVLANFGEVYLVRTKVYSAGRWGFSRATISDVPWSLWHVMQPIAADPSVQDFQAQLQGILWPAGLLVPIVAIPVLVNLLPLHIGRLRVKADTSLTGADAERMLKPPELDLNSAYSDFIVNLTLIAFAFWLSAGRYLIILWLALSAWTFLLCLNYRLNILRWQARTYFGGRETHDCASLLLSLPLGLLAATMEREWSPENTGKLGFTLHVVGHFVFVRYILGSLRPPKDSAGITYSEMMEDEHAPIANYRNTNPIEVLKSVYCTPGSIPAECIRSHRMVFFRNDKWYLQERVLKGGAVCFKGEDCIVQEAAGIWAGAKVEVRVAGDDAACVIGKLQHVGRGALGYVNIAGTQCMSLATRE